MDQQLIKDAIKALKDFSTFWKEGVSFFQGVPNLFKTFVAWDNDRNADNPVIVNNTRTALGLKAK